MTDHHGIARLHPRSFTFTRRRTRRWALGSVVAAVAAGSSLGGAAAGNRIKPGDQYHVLATKSNTVKN